MVPNSIIRSSNTRSLSIEAVFLSSFTKAMWYWYWKRSFSSPVGMSRLYKCFASIVRCTFPCILYYSATPCSISHDSASNVLVFGWTVFFYFFFGGCPMVVGMMVTTQSGEMIIHDCLLSVTLTQSYGRDCLFMIACS